MTAGELVVHGTRLETRRWGPETGPTLVLLHEGLGSVGLWRDFPARLSEATGLGVFAWSRRGYGGSDPVQPPRPLDYMQEEARDWVGPVLDAAGIGRCLLVGHSDGGSIAAAYAGTHQDFRVRGLVLLAPHFVVEDVTIAGIEAARERYLTTDLPARLARHHRDADATFWGWNRAWLDPGFRAFDIQAEVAHLRVPTLLVQGTADPYGTVEQLNIAKREAYSPVDGLVLEGIGHHPHLEAPEAVLAAIADFADRVFRLHEPENAAAD